MVVAFGNYGKLALELIGKEINNKNSIFHNISLGPHQSVKKLAGLASSLDFQIFSPDGT